MRMVYLVRLFLSEDLIIFFYINCVLNLYIIIKRIKKKKSYNQ